MKLKLFRLVTGEDIVADVEGEFDSYYTISNPLKVMYAYGDRPGIIQIGVTQWIFSEVVAKNNFTLYNKDILFVNDISEKMKVTYDEAIKRLDRYLKTSFINDEDLDLNLDEDEEDGEASSLKNERVNKLIEEALRNIKIDKKKLH